MKRYTYPSVIYSDPEKENFTVLFPDLNIVAVGDNTEDIFAKAKELLKSYFEIANRFSAYVPEPTLFEEVVRNNPNKTVMLIDAEVSDKKEVVSDSEKGYKDFLKNFFD